MKYSTKSAIIGRKKRKNKNDINHPIFIHLFNKNNPHTSGTVPEHMLDFQPKSEVILKNLNVKYLTPGNDILINDLTEINIEETSETKIKITGIQAKD